MAQPSQDDLVRITNWTAAKLDAVLVIVLCDEAWFYVVRKGLDRQVVADKLRAMAREVEET